MQIPELDFLVVDSGIYNAPFLEAVRDGNRMSQFIRGSHDVKLLFIATEECVGMSNTYAPHPPSAILLDSSFVECCFDSGQDCFLVVTDSFACFHERADGRIEFLRVVDW